MRKWNTMLLALLFAAAPAAGMAQDLPQLFTEIYDSIGEGLAQGVQMASSELTLSMETDGARLEEGRSMLLTITAGNPLPHDAAVSFSLALPQYVTADGETEWEAVLPAAQTEAKTGAVTPSQTVFTRQITLQPGAESAMDEICCEMAMGTRFYRTTAPLQLCVPRLSVQAMADGTEDGRLNPGDAFAYRMTFVNEGDAPKDAAVAMKLPETAQLAGDLPEGFSGEGEMITGVVHVPAAQAETASHMEVVFPAMIMQNALEEDEDAQRLIAPVITVDGERVAAPRVQICGPRISARLLAGSESLETGEETTLSVVVVNSGLAQTDVQLSCVLPEGLTFADDDEKKEEKSVVPAVQDDGQLPGAGEAIPVEDVKAEPVMHREDRTLVFDVHMDAARQTADGVIAHTQVIEIPVRATIAQGRMTQQALGAALAWSVGDKQAQLGEAVALSVRPQTVLGLTRADWNGVFWAGVLMLLTLICLYAAVKKDKREEDYCFE